MRCVQSWDVNHVNIIPSFLTNLWFNLWVLCRFVSYILTYSYVSLLQLNSVYFQMEFMSKFMTTITTTITTTSTITTLADIFIFKDANLFWFFFSSKKTFLKDQEWTKKFFIEVQAYIKLIVKQNCIEETGIRIYLKITGYNKIIEAFLSGWMYLSSDLTRILELIT